MNNQLKEVIENNLRIIKQAQGLNRRAGETVFPIMSRHQLKEWLMGRLGGARAVSEIVDFAALRFPELDAAQVEKVLADNPVSLEVEGEVLEINYNSFPSAEITEETALRLTVDQVVLPGGRVVLLRCKYSSSDSVPELKADLEKTRIERAWEEKRREVSSELHYLEAASQLSRALSPVEITRTEKGEPILGFLSLMEVYSFGEVKFQWTLRESFEKAKERNHRCNKKGGFKGL